MKNKWITLLICCLSVTAFGQKLEYGSFIELTEIVFEHKKVREAMCTPESEQAGELHIDASTDLTRVYIINNNVSVCADCGDTRLISKPYGELIFANPEVIFFYDVNCFFDPIAITINDKMAIYRFRILDFVDGREIIVGSFEVILKRSKKSWKVKTIKTE